MLSATASPALGPTASPEKEADKYDAKGKVAKAHCHNSRQQPDECLRQVRLDDLPCELVWVIATHVDFADVIAMASVNRHMAASVDGPLRARAINQRTLLRRLRLFVLCVSHAMASRHVSAVRFVRPFVAGDLGPRECVMATAKGHSVHWTWMVTYGDSIRHHDWHHAVDLGYNNARLLALHRHMKTDGIECIVAADKESPGGSAIERAFWTAVTGSHPPPGFDKDMQEQKGLMSCDRSAPAAGVWTRWSANPAVAEAFVREAALSPLPKGTAPKINNKG